MPNYTSILNLYLPNRSDAIEVDVSLADNFQKIDDAFGDLDLSFGVTPEQFGALGNGVANDTTAFQNAVDEAISTKQTLRLKAGATYLVTSSINVNGDLKMVTDGKPNATIKSNSQTFIPLLLTGSLIGSRTLTSSVSANQNYAVISSTSGAQRGDLAIFRSSRVWHFDPRTDGVVSQVHKIHEVSGTTIHLEDQHIESYNTSSETVTVDIVRPIKVHIDGVNIFATKAITGSTSNIVGIRTEYLVDSKFENVHIQDCQGAGMSLRLSYNMVVRDCVTDGTNYLASGYGVQFVGVAHGLAERIKSTNCRRGVDVSGLDVVSTFCKVKNCIMTNSGVDSEGDRYGWLTTGANGGAVYGFGTHGLAYGTVFDGNYVSGAHSAFLIRGKNTEVINNQVRGACSTAVIDLAYGQNLIAKNNTYDSALFGEGNVDWITNGTYSPRDMQPKHFVRIQHTASLNRPSGSYIEVTNNTAHGINEDFFAFTGGSGTGIIPSQANVDVSDNKVTFMPASTATICSVIKNASPDNTSSYPITLATGSKVSGNNFRRVGVTGNTFVFNGVQVRSGSISHSPQTYSFSIANDSIQQVIIGNKEDNAIRLMVDTNEGYALIKVKESSATNYLIGGSKVTTVATALTGTSGSADSLNFNLSGGVLTIENRLGQTEKVHITVMYTM